MHKAAINGARVIVDYFIAKGAMKDARTKDELLTPLHLACQYNHKDVSREGGGGGGDSVFPLIVCSV